MADTNQFFKSFLQGQMQGSIPFQPMFETSEFSRKPDKNTSATQEQIDEVRESIIKDMTTGLGQYASSRRSIAAQFKFSAMRQSSLTPDVIEAALTAIADTPAESAKISHVVKLTYEDDGSGIYGDGVRTFTFEKVNN